VINYAVGMALVAFAFVCATGPTATQPSVKRLLDLIGASVALVLLLPLLLVIAVAIKATSTGPVLVRHRRRGKEGTTATSYAFRTRTWPSSRSGSAAHLTPVGRFLRACNLDRLPHLMSILSGEASLVRSQGAPPSTTQHQGRL
jgi:putative colanic acid biosysnthesis UDP-glucose lipid carrier transferase